IEHTQIGFRQLLRAVLFSTIPQRSLAEFTKPLGNAIHRGVVDIQDRFERTRTASVPQVEDNQITHTDRGDLTFPKPSTDLLLDERRKFGNNIRHGNSSLGRVGPGLSSGIPIFAIKPSKLQCFTDAAESRTVI